MIEQTNIGQCKGEQVIDFTNCQRILIKNKNHCSKTSSIEMCLQGKNWVLQYILQELKFNTFQELTTRAYDIEVSMATNRDT